MEIKEMTLKRLIKEYECNKRQIKTLMSTQKQIEEEIAKRYDKGDLEENDRRTNKEEIN